MHPSRYFVRLREGARLRLKRTQVLAEFGHISGIE
jgi:hypothetical protein